MKGSQEVWAVRAASCGGKRHSNTGSTIDVELKQSQSVTQRVAHRIN